MNAQRNSSEQRRRYERFSIDVPCRIYIPGEDGQVRFEAHANLADVSLGGAFIKSGVRFKEDGADVFVELRFPGRPIPVQGRVVRQPDGGLAIAFREVSLKEREALLEHCAPERYRQFFDEALYDLKPPVALDRVSLILHLWEEWLSGELPRERKPSTEKPAASAKSNKPVAPPPRPAPTPQKPAAAPSKSTARPVIKRR